MNRRSASCIRLAGAERDEWQRWADFMSRQPTGVSISRGENGRSEIIRSPSVRYIAPRTKPVFRALRVDAEGRIWVERYVQARHIVPRAPPRSQTLNNQFPPITWREPPTFDVFEPDGRFLGTVTTPDKATFFEFHGRHIWAVQRGAFEEPYIVRYRIEGTVR